MQSETTHLRDGRTHEHWPMATWRFAMRRCFSPLALAAIVVVLAFHIPAPSAQQGPKPPAKVTAPQTQSAVQDKAKASPPAQPQDTGAAPQTTASVPAGSTNWRVECSSDGKTLDCRAVQQVVVRDSQQLVAGLTVRVPVEHRSR